MIRLEHINLVVSNLSEVLAFYKVAMPHWKILREGDSDWYDKPRHWVHFGDDFSYLAISDNGELKNRDLSGHQVGLAHFAFETSNLKSLVERLLTAGYSIAQDGAVSEYRSNIYFIDPAGFEVEFVEYYSDQPSQRNIDD
jgi:catechol-2,3-dioxygenase